LKNSLAFITASMLIAEYYQWVMKLFHLFIRRAQTYVLQPSRFLPMGLICSV
jgi:hypothetical protein